MFIRIDHRDFHVDVRGPVDAPVVLLLHALGANMAIWEDTTAALARRLRVIRFDFPGHGLSGAAVDGFTMESLARDAFAVLDAQDVAPVHLAGVSIGGMVAQAMAAQRPDALRSLTLCCTLPVFPDPVHEMWRTRSALVRAEGMAPVVDDVVSRWVTASAESSALVTRLRAMVRATDPLAYAAGGEAIAGCDLSAATAAIAVPTLVLAGDSDTATPPERVEAMARAIPGLREFVLLRDAAHIPMAQHPVAVIEAMERTWFS